MPETRGKPGSSAGGGFATPLAQEKRRGQHVPMTTPLYLAARFTVTDPDVATELLGRWAPDQQARAERA